MDIEIKPIDRIVGEVRMPGDKSISHRAVIIGSISKGQTKAENFLTGEDCMHTVSAFQKMGIKISISGKSLKVSGVGLRGLKKPDKALYLGNSGTTMRLISGILAGQDFESTLLGDESLLKRPMARIIEPLRLMGAEISSVNNNGCAPLKIKGGILKSIDYKTKIASAQVKSCVLLAGLYADDYTSLEEPFQSRDHTERMLEYFGADIKKTQNAIRIKSQTVLRAKGFCIPGDISSAVFFIILALILDGSQLTLREIGINPTRRKIIDILLRMGADIKIENEKKLFEPICDLKINASHLKATTVTKEEVPEIIDEIPALSVLAAQASGVTEILGVQELRIKETDRFFSIIDNLKKMGVDISSKGNNLYIKGNRRRLEKTYELKSFGDHRTAMAMCIAAASSSGSSKLTNVDCINTSFPEFFDLLNYLKR